MAAIARLGITHVDVGNLREQKIKAALAAGTIAIATEEALKKLRHLEYPLRRRPRIQKCRRDRKEWRKRQAERLIDALSPPHSA